MTGVAHTGQNASVLRRALLAALLVLSVWAVADRAFDGVTAQHVWTTDAVARLSEPPSDHERPHAAWTAPNRYCMSGSAAGSITQLNDVALAGASRRDGCVSIHRGDLPGGPALYRPLHLSYTPLLI